MSDAATKRVIKLEAALSLIRDGLADTGTGRHQGKRMTRITKADAYQLAVAALDEEGDAYQPAYDALHDSLADAAKSIGEVSP